MKIKCTKTNSKKYTTLKNIGLLANTILCNIQWTPMSLVLTHEHVNKIINIMSHLSSKNLGDKIDSTLITPDYYLSPSLNNNK